jgi:hypothetical protein
MPASNAARRARVRSVLEKCLGRWERLALGEAVTEAEAAGAEAGTGSSDIGHHTAFTRRSRLASRKS